MRQSIEKDKKNKRIESAVTVRFSDGIAVSTAFSFVRTPVSSASSLSSPRTVGRFSVYAAPSRSGPVAALSAFDCDGSPLSKRGKASLAHRGNTPLTTSLPPKRPPFFFRRKRCVDAVFGLGARRPWSVPIPLRRPCAAIPRNAFPLPATVLVFVG